MGTVRYYDNNNRVELRGDIEDYIVNSMTENRLELVYDDSVDPLPDRWAYRVEFIVEDGVLENWDGGPRDGQPHYTGGTLKRVNLYDETGNLLMRISNLDLSMAYVASTIEWDSGWNAVSHILGGGHSFYGADTPGEGDRINTGAGRDIAFGLRGDDWFDDQGGRDVYNGGAGFDNVSYQSHRWANPSADDGIVARLDKGFAVGTDGLRDKLVKIEGVQGSMFNDRMIGNSRDNSFEGLGGKDVIDGKGGWDTVRYDTQEYIGGVGGVSVNLAKGIARDQFGNRDTLRNIEQVKGSDQDDTFRDDRHDNWFDGRDGDDTFYFGRGNDGAEGGGGADTFVFRGDNFGFDQIEDFEDGTDMLQISNAADFAALTVLQDGSDTLVQWNGNEIRLQNVTATDITAGDFIFV